MWVAAFYTKTVPCTLTYSVAIVIYNEGGLAAIPVVKNIIGAIGLACYCWGTTIILSMALSRLKLQLVICSMLIYSKIMGESCIV